MTKALRLAILVALTLLLGVNLKVDAYESPEEEALRHFLAILRLDTQNPPGNEVLVVDYLRGVLQDAGIDAQVFARDPKRPNLVARLRGNGAKRPLLVMGHTDVVTVDASKWKHPPFSATRDGGYIYGRGTQDDKPSVVAGLMTLLQLKRSGRDPRSRRHLPRRGERGRQRAVRHQPHGGAAVVRDRRRVLRRRGRRRGAEEGRSQFAAVTTTEKIPHTVRFVARGVAGHGSVPLQSNAIVHLAQADCEGRGVADADAAQRHDACVLRRPGRDLAARTRRAVTAPSSTAASSRPCRPTSRPTSLRSTRCSGRPSRPTSSRAATCAT